MWEVMAKSPCKEQVCFLCTIFTEQSQSLEQTVSSAESFNRMEEPNPEQHEKVGIHYKVIRVEI